jgi:hypothetical protein
MSTLEEVRARVQQRDEALIAALRTPEGVALLRVLEAEFYDCSLMAATPEQTAYNLGRRDVVAFLRNVRERSMK